MDKAKWYRGNVLLRLRRQQEQSARQDFMRARSRVAACRRRLERLRAHRAERDGEARAALLEGRTIMSLYRQWVRRVDESLKAETVRLADRARRLEQSRQALLEAAIRRKAAGCLANWAWERCAARREREESVEIEDVHAVRRADGQWDWVAIHDG